MRAVKATTKKTITTKNAPKRVPRSRVPAATPKAEAGTNPLEKMAADYYAANEARKKFATASEKLREQLLGEMGRQGIEKFELPAHGNTPALVATIESRNTTTIDLQALSKLVSFEVLMQVVSASVSAVTAVAGKEVLAQVAIPGKSSPNVNVNPKK